jgi:hypothetical protein
VEVSAPLKVTWTMKDLSSARSETQELPDGRFEMRVEHELIRAVTPEMVVWWFRNFPTSRLEHHGRLIQMFRLWHPRDHIRARVTRRPFNRARGFSKGARVVFIEVLGGEPIRMRAKVAQMDETGMRLVVRRLWLLKVADVRHEYGEAPGGTLWRSRIVIGSALPLVGRLFSRVIRRRVFTPDRCAAWIQHDVEETGNLEFILPKLYEQRPDRD